MSNEVYCIDQDGKTIESPLTSFKDICEGMEVSVPSIIGRLKMKVVRDRWGEFSAEDESNVAQLNFIFQRWESSFMLQKIK